MRMKESDSHALRTTPCALPIAICPLRASQGLRAGALYAADRGPSSWRSSLLSSLSVERAAKPKQGIAQLADLFQRDRRILQQRDRHLASTALQHATRARQLDV